MPSYSEDEIKILERNFKRLQRNLGQDYLAYPSWARKFMASRRAKERKADIQLSIPLCNTGVE